MYSILKRKKRKNLLHLSIILSVFFVISSCSTYKKNIQETKEHKTVHVSKNDCASVHWSHQKEKDGPKNWKNLCDGFTNCGGNAQSPIDISTNQISTVNTLAGIQFNYTKSAFEIINNGHTVQFNISGDNHVNLNGTDYKLLQFHYHALSEHTIDGKYYPLEVHFVHKNSDTNFAVIGVLFEEGESNDLFAKYLANFPTGKGSFKPEEMIDVLNLFPNNKSYYNYKGSLTTPPCSEVVNWYVLKTPLTVSKKQIEVFSKILNNNYRPVQPINNRVIQVFNQ